ncbi:hypothetical protein JQX09_04750 [Sulfitobacter pseudonitzschiae]|uniref:Uncharacterized protein n=1 Tax=Pseudosulfitobacter pseudonitzschiae TaxID=1402135 RepID=A0A9Q2RRC0_9RHOB|nr:hypothetical protein [Pseudosulfitobacter pseudonitzschiae]MBM2291202.1 hypothetical protein [Pseudosulfitobacter pseudonitzschiae]MBM2296120.1 hypothetical protein [Pseudosulfitobacter pseudonitzschiae]MBM2301033.1 hypothetical protein [Pseudosulfitobacter pseudonitzschiae]MBM2310817.1 hypothetical protein [Pseudosulfitobacter pseudonitzschiae]MBM2315730.1 hypothetical protein [Pseudosulfitobacter pseudonitzschiae]
MSKTVRRQTKLTFTSSTDPKWKTGPARRVSRISAVSPFRITHARNQGRRPPRIAGPPAGTAIWLPLRVTDNSDELGCHKVPVTEVGSPHHAPTMRGFAFYFKRQFRPAKPTLPNGAPNVWSRSEIHLFHANIPHAKGGPAEPPEKMYKTPPNMYEIRFSGAKPANPAVRNMYRTGPNMYQSA